MKQKEKAIKYSKWTTTFFWTFILLFILITVGGMVYSYTNLIQLAFKLSYSDNVLKANFWPIFTELTMVCLSVLLLVIRFNKWPKLWLFKFVFYLFAGIVLLANAYNTSITDGFNLNSSVDLAIQELPVICYLVFLEIALFVVTNVINDRVTVESKPRQTESTVIDSKLSNENKEGESIPTEFIEQPEVNKKQKDVNKKKLLKIFKNNPTIGQNAAGRKIGINQSTASVYTRELKESGQLDKQNGIWNVIESDW